VIELKHWNIAVDENTGKIVTVNQYTNQVSVFNYESHQKGGNSYKLSKYTYKLKYGGKSSKAVYKQKIKYYS
jgi:hypothetical protein